MRYKQSEHINLSDEGDDLDNIVESSEVFDANDDKYLSQKSQPEPVGFQHHCCLVHLTNSMYFTESIYEYIPVLCRLLNKSIIRVEQPDVALDEEEDVSTSRISPPYIVRFFLAKNLHIYSF